jgi:molecular chaperone GrpE
MSAPAEDQNNEQSLGEGVDTANGVEPQTGVENADAVEAPVEEQPSVEDVLAQYSADEVTRLRDEASQAEDRALRAKAELENYRKRAQREIVEERRYAPLPLVRDLLSVADNIDRAIAAAEQTDQNAALLEGFRMVAAQLHNTLEKHGCKRIEAEDQMFDPHLHEAISQLPSRDHPPGSVVQVTLSGYQLHDRVVRPAQVIVAAPPVNQAPDEAADDSPA